MLNSIHTAIAGNLTADPELRFTQSGKAVAAFTVASTPRIRQADGTYQDGTPTFMRVDAWGPLGENVAESFHKGDRVAVIGTLRTETWETDQGEKRSAVKMAADEVGASVQFATVSIRKATRNAGPDPVDPYTGESASERTAPVGDDAEAPV